MASGWQIRVRGLVQGVGFRPWIWRLAGDGDLRGEVLNDSGGVVIRLFCRQAQLDGFLAQMRRDAPPLARIDSIEVAPLRAAPPPGFTIVGSQSGTIRTGITPDAATCTDCRAEIFAPGNRRFGYAFTNCTNCGPRLTITRAIPYDRDNTTMSAFAMCPACQAEYDDPQDRRFHAQPNACPVCGPRLSLVARDGCEVAGDPVANAVRLLQAGRIIAIKGLGGFQLAVDAGNEQAVATLRTRKRRPAKPLALMVRDTHMAGRYVLLSDTGRRELEGWQAPIVLAPALPGAASLAPGIAPGQNRLGLMLPNTPLHHLLMRALERPIVLTSGNLAQEPQATDNDEARTRLAGIADFWLLHDRAIVNRMDDSVVQVVGNNVQVLRRARGHAPGPVALHPGFAKALPVLAMGADMKNTFCLLKDGQAIVSQHMGDMVNPQTQRDFHANLDLYQRVYDFKPRQIAVDLHPGYFATRLGQDAAAQSGAALARVQHHHAHIAAVLGEHGFAPDCDPVLGVVLDGLGHGQDGTIWGGEFLLANFTGYRRLAHFPPVALPGGDKANQQPWRNMLAHLLAAFGEDGFTQLQQTHGRFGGFADLAQKPTGMLVQMIRQGVNSPLASSAGRLFDAVAACLGVCFNGLGFEGQAAMQLQAMAETCPHETGTYGHDCRAAIQWKALWQGILSDLKSGIAPEIIAKRFHNTLARMVARKALEITAEGRVCEIVLTGGVFQNGLLLHDVQALLRSKGVKTLTPKQYPANDGGLSLGQATVLAARVITRPSD